METVQYITIEHNLGLNGYKEDTIIKQLQYNALTSYVRATNGWLKKTRHPFPEEDSVNLHSASVRDKHRVRFKGLLQTFKAI